MEWPKDTPILLVYYRWISSFLHRHFPGQFRSPLFGEESLQGLPHTETHRPICHRLWVSRLVVQEWLRNDAQSVILRDFNTTTRFHPTHDGNGRQNFSWMGVVEVLDRPFLLTHFLNVDTLWPFSTTFPLKVLSFSYLSTTNLDWYFQPHPSKETPLPCTRF